MSISYEERKKLFDNIKQLVKPEQEEIFRIIKKYKENYTENSNGIFFDLQCISDESLIKMKEYMDFCLKNRLEHESRLKEMDELRNETFVKDDDASIEESDDNTN